jgi:hypothetical protein
MWTPPVSPLLANLCMRRFVLGWKMHGLEQSIVILCRRGKAEEALSRLREIMGKLKLTVNEGKTRICKVQEEEFDFLGYSFGLMYSAKTGKACFGRGGNLPRRMITIICERRFSI